MPCPTCGLKLRVPEMEFRETRCDYCRTRGKDGRTSAAYFPLGDRLLEHLRYIDTERDGLDRQKLDVEKANESMLAARERHAANDREAVTKDYYTKIAGIESVGYTGREQSWIKD